MKNAPPNPYKVGDRIEISLHSGRVAEGIVKSMFETTIGWKFNVAIGESQAATIELWQIVKRVSE